MIDLRFPSQAPGLSVNKLARPPRKIEDFSPRTPRKTGAERTTGHFWGSPYSKIKRSPQKRNLVVPVQGTILKADEHTNPQIPVPVAQYKKRRGPVGPLPSMNLKLNNPIHPYADEYGERI